MQEEEEVPFKRYYIMPVLQLLFKIHKGVLNPIFNAKGKRATNFRHNTCKGVKTLN